MAAFVAMFGRDRSWFARFKSRPADLALSKMDDRSLPALRLLLAAGWAARVRARELADGGQVASAWMLLVDCAPPTAPSFRGSGRWPRFMQGR